MNGDGAFNAHILVDKLAKLNSSQQSIETLSHWCIFHRRNAKQVVETWERQFYSSPKDQRLYFLYLANDILQNSRRKSMEFVGEFWKVIPYALRDVIDNGDEFGRKAAVRLENSKEISQADWRSTAAVNRERARRLPGFGAAGGHRG
ncbi:regulation of nuclear pre-mRNA domain-containing protein 1A-like [Asparagus officinalis]|uniref:regulation of nuclear pre-mRNA domain-containing protein 1A-like n=1 Tax=Asparagus officinalis TaxID=4686 RepID=UPI00098E072C|nr:regulation of nuclear pre-mRNA domain-containing protein 1A-like [Asparagus officinalis]XP_020261112.1 regulation of nuclear pre-mRNA domain-containing protein 1A-like [Asparagus officinalis]XP_020261113.1 regulation of nuclear pre-mRNA domain-containing protein 1A-like [Asparagus officinalis]